MTNHSVMTEKKCLPGHQREQSLVHYNIFINKLEYRVSSILKKLVDDAKCAGVESRLRLNYNSMNKELLKEIFSLFNVQHNRWIQEIQQRNNLRNIKSSEE